jgi:hypothetical protein
MLPTPAQNPQWELDLHGLHISEALEALAQRLDAVEAHWTAQQQQQAQAQQQPGARQPGGGAAPPRRATLRVIVGRGTHSSGGEASLPRAVAGWLADAGLSHRLAGGAIDVALRPGAWARRRGGPGGAAAAPAVVVCGPG